MPDQSAPPAIHQTTNTDSSSSCPFCTISSTYPPIPSQNPTDPAWDPDKLAPPSYVLLSTESVIAFLDIAPLTRGHVLVAPRRHRTKMGDLSAAEMAEIGRVLPLIARSVVRSVLPDIPHDEADYNIIQNNGPGAAQVIPHLHFHIIPRPPLNYVTPSPAPQSSHSHSQSKSQSQAPRSKYAASAQPTGLQKSYIQFGRGFRHELDDEDASTLIVTMRHSIREEWEREFGTAQNGRGGSEGVERFMGGVEDAAWIEGSGGLVRNLERRARGDGFGNGRGKL